MPDRPTAAVEAAEKAANPWTRVVMGDGLPSMCTLSEAEIAAKVLDAYEQALAATPEGKRYLLGLALSEGERDAALCAVTDWPGGWQSSAHLRSLSALLSSSTGERPEDS